MSQTPLFVICVEPQDAEDLKVLKVYRRIEDPDADGRGYFRVIDESREDYLYPQSLFRSLPLPAQLEHQLDLLVPTRRSE